MSHLSLRTTGGRSRPVKLALALGALAAGAAGAVRAETLADAIALAYQTNPTLQGQRASLRALDESIVQAEAGYRATVTAQANVASDSNNNTSIATRNLPGVAQQIVNGRSATSGAAVSVVQPLYTGGRVRDNISAAEAQDMAGRETLRNSEQTILRQVITAYADVRRDQANVEIIEEDVRLLGLQVDEIRARFGVGEITRTDVAQTEARFAAAQAQLAASRAQLAADRAAYASVVGQDPGTLAPEPPLSKFLPDSLDKAYADAEENSPALRVAAFSERASAAKLAAAKAQTRPTVSVQFNYGYSGGSYTERNAFGVPGHGDNPFVDYSHDMSANAVATFPIFNGGMTSSQIRQAAETNNADRINIETARRQVLLTVAQAWSGLMGARASLGADEAQVKGANLAFEGSRQESRVGLRSTLDVLIAEQDLSSAELALVSARHDEYVAAANVLAAVGGLYPQDFSADTPVYDPKVNLDRIRRTRLIPTLAPLAAQLDRLGAPETVRSPPPVSPAH